MEYDEQNEPEPQPSAGYYVGVKAVGDAFADIEGPITITFSPAGPALRYAEYLRPSAPPKTALNAKVIRQICKWYRVKPHEIGIEMPGAVFPLAVDGREYHRRQRARAKRRP